MELYVLFIFCKLSSEHQALQGFESPAFLRVDVGLEDMDIASKETFAFKKSDKSKLINDS